MHKVVLVRRKTPREILEEQGFKIIGVVERGDRGDLALVEVSSEVKHQMKVGDYVIEVQDDKLVKEYFRGTGKDKEIFKEMKVDI